MTEPVADHIRERQKWAGDLYFLCAMAFWRAARSLPLVSASRAELAEILRNMRRDNPAATLLFLRRMKAAVGLPIND